MAHRRVAVADRISGDLITKPGLIFPTPSRLAEAPLEECGINARRAAAIRSVAARVIDGDLLLESGLAEESALQTVPGIGPWTAAYVALRGLRDRDAIPVADLGLRLALGLDTTAEVAARSERWRPFRGYAAAYLWSTFLELEAGRGAPVAAAR